MKIGKQQQKLAIKTAIKINENCKTENPLLPCSNSTEGCIKNLCVSAQIRYEKIKNGISVDFKSVTKYFCRSPKNSDFAKALFIWLNITMSKLDLLVIFLY